MTSLLNDPNLFRILLISIGIIGISVIFYFSWKKSPRPKKSKGPVLLLHLDDAASSLKPEQEMPPEDKETIPEPPSASKPAFTTLQKPSGPFTDLLRAFLIILAVLVAAGCILALLPQRTIDQMAQNLQSRHTAARPERIALLYLGDEAKEGTLRIRGVVRNISTEPIEQLDAVVRFYARDRNPLETILVRMDKETIAPDEIARLELVVPNQAMQYAAYAVEFKLRQGESVAYKDMRKPKFPQ